MTDIIILNYGGKPHMENDSTEKLYTIGELQRLIFVETGYKVSQDVLKARIREGVIPAVNIATPWEAKVKMRIRESDIADILARYPKFEQQPLFNQPEKGE